jgi:Phosphate-induced protein 1 conserved region
MDPSCRAQSMSTLFGMAVGTTVVATSGDTATQSIVTDFLGSLGGTPYFQINTGYPNSAGQTPSGAMFYANAVFDRYSHGVELTASDIQEIIRNKILSGELSADSFAIYVVLASADVGSVATGLCVPSMPPHHGIGIFLGVAFRYAFVGNPMRCPSTDAAQFFSGGTQLPTPNDHLGADAMASTLAHVISTTITDPSGTGWFDRYGLETADKCDGQFGQTYLTTNGARANLRLGPRDFLIQENWVNSKKGHCAMNSSQ